MGFEMPVKRPGAYQMRVAARDRSSSKIGSAGQFVLIPDLKNQRLAVSGIVLATGAADQKVANQGARRFVQNSELYYACKLYNATNGNGKLRNLVMNVMLFRDGKVVYTGPETPIVATEQSDLNRLPIGGGCVYPCNLWLILYFVRTSRKNSTARGSPDSPSERIACLRTS